MRGEFAGSVLKSQCRETLTPQTRVITQESDSIGIFTPCSCRVQGGEGHGNPQPPANSDAREGKSPPVPAVAQTVVARELARQVDLLLSG